MPWTLPADGYQLLYADNDTLAGYDHLSFRLSGSGETLGIFQVTAGDTVQITLFDYLEVPVGFSSARLPNGTGAFQFTFNKTPGAANIGSAIISGLVINEFSAQPTSVVDNAGDRDDWIELYNSSNVPINLHGLFITDTLGNKLKHTLNDNGLPWILAPGAYQLLWADGEPLAFEVNVDAARR